ncbi:oocyte-specific homeobox protein 8-like [Arvicanthis niloticus]|uniref:oocyte-specific homeobox protein 8-like n=1 Tax=Arvicanthis niloticus TaxID=61156 RepID=UPI00402B965E
MQESTDFPGFPIQNAPPTNLPTHWSPRLPLSTDLQIPQALPVPHHHQMPQRPQLSEGFQIPQDPLMPHCLQISQICPLFEGLQLTPAFPVNPGFQVCPSPSAPLEAPQVLPRPHVPQKAPVREWKGRTRYSPEQKSKLETFFFEKSKYPTLKEQKKLAQSISVMEYQIRIWFKNRRSIYFRKHPQERLKTSSSQRGRGQVHCTSTRD